VRTYNSNPESVRLPHPFRCPDEDEAALTLRALVDVNECKFLAPDVPLFHAICADLFPGVDAHPPAHAALRGAILRQCASSVLQPTPYFLCKARPAASARPCLAHVAQAQISMACPTACSRHVAQVWAYYAAYTHCSMQLQVMGRHAACFPAAPSHRLARKPMQPPATAGAAAVRDARGAARHHGGRPAAGG